MSKLAKASNINNKILYRDNDYKVIEDDWLLITNYKWLITKIKYDNKEINWIPIKTPVFVWDSEWDIRKRDKRSEMLLQIK